MRKKVERGRQRRRMQQWSALRCQTWTTSGAACGQPWTMMMTTMMTKQGGEGEDGIVTNKEAQARHLSFPIDLHQISVLNLSN